MTIDLNKLNKVIQASGAMERLHPDFGSVSLVHRPGVSDPWMDGIAPYLGESKNETDFSEGSFTEVCPGLQGTYFDDIRLELRSFLSNSLGRIRIFKRNPVSVSSAHSDLDIRIHIPLETNLNSYIVFPAEGVFHLPADGSVYVIDTTRLHFAANAHRAETRTHIIFNTYCGFYESRALAGEILAFARGFYRNLVERPGVTEFPRLKV